MGKDPIPLEPVVGSVVLDKNGVAWQRERSQWYPATDTDSRDDYAGIGSLMWGLLNKLFSPLTVLAPESVESTTPVAEPEAPPEPKIPWEGKSVSGYTIQVGFEGPSSVGKGSVRIVVGRGATRVTPGNARGMATALLKAARRVETLDKAAEELDR